MLDTLKSLWAKWKVQVSFVGGALVVATTLEPVLTIHKLSQRFKLKSQLRS